MAAPAIFNFGKNVNNSGLYKDIVTTVLLTVTNLW